MYPYITLLTLYDVQAIDEFMRLLKLTSKSSTVHGALKLAPLWLVRLALVTGLLSLMTNLFRTVMSQIM